MVGVRLIPAGFLGVGRRHLLGTLPLATNKVNNRQPYQFACRRWTWMPLQLVNHVLCASYMVFYRGLPSLQGSWCAAARVPECVALPRQVLRTLWQGVAEAATGTGLPGIWRKRMTCKLRDACLCALSLCLFVCCRTLPRIFYDLISGVLWVLGPVRFVG